MMEMLHRQFPRPRLRSPVGIFTTSNRAEAFSRPFLNARRNRAELSNASLLRRRRASTRPCSPWPRPGFGRTTISALHGRRLCRRVRVTNTRARRPRRVRVSRPHATHELLPLACTSGHTLRSVDLLSVRHVKPTPSNGTARIHSEVCVCVLCVCVSVVRISTVMGVSVCVGKARQTHHWHFVFVLLSLEIFACVRV